MKFSMDISSFSKLKKDISQLHKSPSIVAFIKKVFHNNVIQLLQKSKDSFLNTTTQSNVEKDLIRGHINKHYDHIILMRLDDCESKEKLQLIVGNIFTSVLLISTENSLHKERFKLFKTYNKKIAKLIKNKKDDTFANYSAPIINLSNYALNDSECSQLKFGLNHCASKQVDPS